MHSSVWTEERTKILALTDPTQYFGNGITHKADQPMSSLKDLEGKAVGTITGFSFIPELEKIPGIPATVARSPPRRRPPLPAPPSVWAPASSATAPYGVSSAPPAA